MLKKLSGVLQKGAVATILSVFALLVGVWSVVEYFYFITADKWALVTFLVLRAAAVCLLFFGAISKRWKAMFAIAVALVFASIVFANGNQSIQQAVARTVCADHNMNFDVQKNRCVPL